MSRADLVIRGGTVVSPAGRLRGGLAVRDGVVVAVATDEALPPAGEVIDARGLHVLPGVIDAHVHVREPGFEYKEDNGIMQRRIRQLREAGRVDPLAHLESRPAIITPFEGMKVKGRPVATIVRGRVVMRDGELVGSPGWGRPVVGAGTRAGSAVSCT